MLTLPWVLSLRSSPGYPKELTGPYLAKCKDLQKHSFLLPLVKDAPWGRNTGQEWPKDCQQHSDSVLRPPFGKGAGETGSGMGLGAVLVSLSTLSWAACSSATFDVR